MHFDVISDGCRLCCAEQNLSKISGAWNRFYPVQQANKWDFPRKKSQLEHILLSWGTWQLSRLTIWKYLKWINKSKNITNTTINNITTAFWWCRPDYIAENLFCVIRHDPILCWRQVERFNPFPAPKRGKGRSVLNMPTKKIQGWQNVPDLWDTHVDERFTWYASPHCLPFSQCSAEPTDAFALNQTTHGSGPATQAQLQPQRVPRSAKPFSIRATYIYFSLMLDSPAA